MYDFSSYNRISPELSSPCTPTARETRGFEWFLQCERTPYAPKTFRLSQQRWQMRENAHSSSLGSPLFCTGECCADLWVVFVHEGQFFLKNGARHCASDMRIKIACVDIHFSVTTVVTMVVTTVVATVVTIVLTTGVTENHMSTHAILFLMLDVRCRATIFFLNHVYFAHRASEDSLSVQILKF